MANYRKVLEETEKAISANRGFRAKNLYVATYKQMEKGLLFLS